MLELIGNPPRLPSRLMIYGVEGIGKSTLCSLAPDPIFLQTEDGLSGIACKAFPLAKDVNFVLQAITSLSKEEHAFKTLVTDSADWLDKLIVEEVCKENKVSDLLSIPYGRGYELAYQKWVRILKGLDLLRSKGMNIIFTAHAQIEKFDNPTLDTPIDRYTPRLQKKASALLREWADAVLFANRIIRSKSTENKTNKGVFQSERFLFTEETPAYSAKNRFSLPSSIPMDQNVFELCKFFK